MSTQRERVIARLNSVRADLDEVLRHLNPSLMPWAPSAGMRTVAGQLVEIAGSEYQLLMRVAHNEVITDGDIRDEIGTYEDFETLRKYLDDVRRQTLEYIGSLSDEALEEEVSIPGWHESIGLPSLPRIEFFIGVASHEAYHVGQLVSYLWARGDNPYEW